MKSILLVTAFLFAAVFCVKGQVPSDAIKADGNSAESALKVSPKGSARSDYVRPDSKTRFKRYVKSMFGPMALGKSVLSAGYATWRNSPEEWGDKWEGFGKRFASSMGKSVIKNTTMYGLDEAFKLDSQYYRSKNKSVASRVGNALLSPVTARNQEGKRVLGFPRIIGTYTGSIVAAETWYPSRYDYKDGLKNGTVSLGLNAAFNLVKEFIWKK